MITHNYMLISVVGKAVVIIAKHDTLPPWFGINMRVWCKLKILGIASSVKKMPKLIPAAAICNV